MAIGGPRNDSLLMASRDRVFRTTSIRSRRSRSVGSLTSKQRTSGQGGHCYRSQGVTGDTARLAEMHNILAANNKTRIHTPC